MRMVRLALTLGVLSAGLYGVAEAATPPGASKPHDAAAPVTRRIEAGQREAAVVTRTACDTIFCPGYALIGVGF